MAEENTDRLVICAKCGCDRICGETLAGLLFTKNSTFG